MRVFATRWSFVAALAVLPVFAFELYAVPAAHADAKSKADIDQKIKAAMENYDLLEYEEARKLLNQALTVAKRAKMDSEPITAKVHMSLGIVYFAGLGDAESAKLSFLNAVEIDPDIQIDKAYATPEMVKLLEDARSEAPDGGGGGGAPSGPEPMSVDCATVTGMQHTIIESAQGGRDLTVEAALGADVGAAKVSIMYRPRGASEFQEAPMTLSSQCVYGGKVPASALGGDLIHYYVAAYNAAGKVIASKGSAGSPNIIEVAAAAGGGGGGAQFGEDDEDPLAGGGHSSGGNRTGDGDDEEPGGGGGGGGGGGVGVKVPGGPSGKRTLFLAIAAGSGGGYVTGATEQENNDVKCCFAPQLLHLMPELGYYLSARTSVSVAVRLGFPIGANIPGHSPVAPAGILRIRRNLSEGGSGLMVVGGLGGGVLRNTIQLDGAPAGMDTDVVALGPLIVNLGAGYNAALGGGVNLVAELNTLTGVPVVKTLDNSTLNFGVQFDFNLGLVLGF